MCLQKGLIVLEQLGQKELCGFIGKVFRDSFGKGPESVFISFGGNFVTIYLRNFMSPTEQILMEQDQEETVVSTRAKLMQRLIPEIKANIEVATRVELREVYYDWGLHNRSGMIVGISSVPFESPLTENYMRKQDLHKEIDTIGLQSEKIAAKTYSFELNPRILIVVRQGLLVPIEKELIRLGYVTTLRYAKGNLEKRHLHNNGHFEAVLGKQIMDLFVDWDFVLDKSVIVFVMSEKN